MKVIVGSPIEVIFPLTFCPPLGFQTELVQLAFLHALPPAVASSTQESERAFRHRSPLILSVPENPALLQCLLVPGDGFVPGVASGSAPSRAGCEATLLLWTGAPHRSGKLCAVVLLQHLLDTMRFILSFMY